MKNILELHQELRNKVYIHGGYEHFVVSDPKRRDIHKTGVRDRLLHHAVYRILYPYYDTHFISDSYSCRNDKGTHKAIDRFATFTRKVSRNHTRTCYVLKCDIRKFFASIDHKVLFKILEREITSSDINDLLKKVVQSFHTTQLGKGLPLGNLTSQLFVNIYMNEFDQFVKHKLKTQFYIRYADDFVILSREKTELTKTLSYMIVFLRERLALKLHPNKVSIVTIASGVDFLGWVQFTDHKVLRSVTKKRLIKKLQNPELSDARTQSYLGLLKHGNTNRLRRSLNR